jgi:recombination DNA repair RAD52 pathway protein
LAPGSPPVGHGPVATGGVVVPKQPKSSLTDTQLQALLAAINPNRVSSRRVGNQNLSYVESWDIRAALIRVFGFGGFSIETIEAKVLDIRDDGRQGKYPDTHATKAGQFKTPYAMAQATVRLTVFGIGPQGQDVVYSASAVGSNDGFTIGDIVGNAIKTAESDALKRAAINLGTQFGLSLYQNGSKTDVVRMVLQPEQNAAIQRFRAQAESARDEAQRLIDRATQVDQPVAPDEPVEQGEPNPAPGVDSYTGNPYE